MSSCRSLATSLLSIAMVATACSSTKSPNAGAVHGTAQLAPPKAGAPRPSSTIPSTTPSTTTTTTTTIPPPPTAPPPRAPLPVRLGAVCTIPGGIGQTTAGQDLRCLNHKGVDGKPYANGVFRWTVPG